MAELILYPTSDISHGNNWSIYTYTEIDEVELNEADYALLGGFNTGAVDEYVSYGWTNHTTETGTITDVTMYTQAEKTNTGTGNNISMYFGVPDYNYQSSAKTITTSSTLFSYSWGATNPATSTDWTWDDIDGFTSAIRGVGAGDKDNYSNLYVYQSKIVVTFTPSGGWANIAKFNGVASASIAKINGIPVANIAKINGVAV